MEVYFEKVNPNKFFCTFLSSKSNHIHSQDIFKQKYQADSLIYSDDKVFLELSDTATSVSKAHFISSNEMTFDEAKNTATILIRPHKKVTLPNAVSFYFNAINIKSLHCKDELYIYGNQLLDSYWNAINERPFNNSDKIKEVALACN